MNRFNRAGVALGFLMLVRAAPAQQKENPPAQTTQDTPVLQSQGPITPMPAHPAPFEPPLAQPAAVVPAPVEQPRLQQPAVSTAPATVLVLPGQPKPVERPLGSDLHGRIDAERANFKEKMSSARRDFDARQASEAKEFAAEPRTEGFWEARRLRKKFRAGQALRLKEFNDEQEQKRKTYEWRFP